MPTRELLSEARRSHFAGIPDMAERELARHHTLSETDLAAIAVRRGAANRLGFVM